MSFEPNRRHIKLCIDDINYWSISSCANILRQSQSRLITAMSYKTASRHVREPHAKRFASISLMEHDLEHEIWFRLQLLISLRFRVFSKKVRKKLSCSRLELRSICRFLHAERVFSLGDWIIKPNSVNTLMNRINFRQTSLSLRRPVDLRCKGF